MYANQKKLIQKNIGKEVPFNPEDKAHIKADIRFHNGFLYIRNEVISRAMCNLTGNSLKLYLSLASCIILFASSCVKDLDSSNVNI